MFNLSKLRPALRLILPALNRQAVQGVRKASTEAADSKLADKYTNAWRYREPNLDVLPSTMFKANYIATLMWYWILFHCWYDWGRLTGHGLPDPKDWTDEELGIPPDDEDI